jgi:hypothetical protein
VRGGPKITCCLYSAADTVTERSPCWRRALPLSAAEALDRGQPRRPGRVSHGDYFTAVRRFLKADGFAALNDALHRRLGSSVAGMPIDSVGICLEKHGQFYHPARVTAAAGGRRAAFVVNVAVAASGRSVLKQDYDNIRLLSARFPYRFLPRVYARAAVSLPGGSRRVEMFLGDWLDGYHEFHLSGRAVDGNRRLVLWDPEKGARPLTRRQRRAVYRQAALVLTAYYDLETGAHISAWHNAAGDFVVKTDGGPMDLRLVTVRAYASLFAAGALNAGTVLQALLIFWLKTSIRLRLDRRNGTGAYLWADDDAVAAALGGLFDGLRLQVRHGRIPPELPDLFAGYLKTLSPGDRDALLDAVAQRIGGPAPERELIGKHLRRHGEAMTAAIDSLCRGPRMPTT